MSSRSAARFLEVCFANRRGLFPRPSSTKQSSSCWFIRSTWCLCVLVPKEGLAWLPNSKGVFTPRECLEDYCVIVALHLLGGTSLQQPLDRSGTSLGILQLRWQIGVREVA